MTAPAPEAPTTVDPPRGFFATLRRIGPGLIVAGSIVGSGELIATTKTGADAGFWLLWLVIVGCVIKVFVQVELGRYAVSSGEATIAAMNRVPGPRLRQRGNWIIWYWFVMFLASIAQLGGIVGGVGQALSISLPLTEQGFAYDRVARFETQGQVATSELRRALSQEGVVLDGDSPTEVNLDAPSFALTHRLIDAKFAGAELQFDRITAELERAGRSSRWGRVAGNEEDDPDAVYRSIDLPTVQRRVLLGEWRGYFDEVKRYFDGASAFHSGVPITTSAGETLEGSEADIAWIKQHLRALQSQLLDLNSLSPLLAELRPLREAFSIAEEASDEARMAELREAMKPILEREAELLESIRERQREIGFTNREPFATRFAVYEQEIAAVPLPIDDRIWAGVVAVITSLILMKGRFGLILSFSTAMVACFTAVTIVNLILLQRYDAWAVSWSDIATGLSFRFPPDESTSGALATALKTFGIIGVGATELVAYPYWCLEQGYARFTGPRDDSEAWAQRARGWMRVMWVDAWGSMLIYTFATIAFYLLGASVLGRSGVDPSEHSLIRYLTVMFAPVFGPQAEHLFLFGAFAVLYSTLFVATASHARVFSDALRILGFIPKSTRSYDISVMVLSAGFPMLCLVIYLVFPKPTFLVMLSGLMQAVMLPMLAATALYLRYQRTDARLLPGWLWDACLWLSSLGMLIAGGWLAWSELGKLLR